MLKNIQKFAAKRILQLAVDASIVRCRYAAFFERDTGKKEKKKQKEIKEGIWICFSKEERDRQREAKSSRRRRRPRSEKREKREASVTNPHRAPFSPDWIYLIFQTTSVCARLFIGAWPRECVVPPLECVIIITPSFSIIFLSLTLFCLPVFRSSSSIFSVVFFFCCWFFSLLSLWSKSQVCLWWSTCE